MNLLKKIKEFFLKDGLKWDKKKFLLLIFILVVLLGTTSSFAKYVYFNIKDYYLSTKGFYFNCDKLSSNGNFIEMTNWSGVGQYEVTFNMNSISNGLVKTNEDIYYDISYSCSTNVRCDVKGNKTSGVINKVNNKDSFIIVITVPTTTVLKDRDRVSLKVSVHSTSPYRKSLSGTFNLVVGYYGLSYEINDKKGNPYLDVNITNTLDYYKVVKKFGNYDVDTQLDVPTYLALSDEEKKNCVSARVTLSFDPTIVSLDMTNDIYLNALSTKTKRINNYDYIQSVTFSIEALSSNRIKFYKNDTTKDYTYPNIDNSSIIKVEYN